MPRPGSCRAQPPAWAARVYTIITPLATCTSPALLRASNEEGRKTSSRYSDRQERTLIVKGCNNCTVLSSHPSLPQLSRCPGTLHSHIRVQFLRQVAGRGMKRDVSGLIGKRHQEPCKRGFCISNRAGKQRFTQSKEGSSEAAVSSVNIWQLQSSEIILPPSSREFGSGRGARHAATGRG